MQANIVGTRLIKSGLAALALLLANGASAQQVNLTAGAAQAAMPDGSAVSMWGYTCGAAVSGSTATCAALNPNPNPSLNPLVTTPWSPVVITVPYGQDLQINLTNQLSFAIAGGTGANTVPTSLVIVGQLGGGLGSPTTKSSPAHAVQGATWPIVGDTNGATFQPPKQGPRVQSFGTEVGYGATTTLTWVQPRPGTYLIESGTHPSIQGPMGLYGILVVTCPPKAAVSASCPAPGTAYPGVAYNAELPLLLSEIDPLQNNAVQTAVSSAGFSETSARVLRDSLSSVSPPLDANGNAIPTGSGYVSTDTITFSAVCSTQPTAAISGLTATGAISAVTVTSPGAGCTQVPSVAVTSATGTGAVLTAALSLSGVMCSDGAGACYPPAVNYTPLYYLINGVAFDKTNPAISTFPAMAGVANALPVTTGISGNVLVRLVNAGLRMHVPSIVGSAAGTPAAPGLALVAEDGNPLPGRPRVQSEVFMPAGKTFDVMVNGPAICAPLAPATTCAQPPATLPIFDRELSLSGNASNRDSGMLAYISINGGAPPSTSATGAAAVARNDTYNALMLGQTLNVSDPAKGLIANDTNVYGVALQTAPKSGVVSLNMDGTFTYTPSVGFLTSLTLVSGGSGYSTPPAVSITGGGGSGATATAAITTGVIGSIGSIHDPGMTAPLMVTITDTTGLNATATATTNGTTINFTVTNGGSGYSSSPTVTVKDSAAIPNTASAVAYVGIVSGLTLTSVGNGYTSPPAVAIASPPAGTTALANAAIDQTTNTVSINPDSFTYSANGRTTLSATVSLGQSSIVDSGITCAAPVFTSNVATYLAVAPPGVLASCTDGAALAMTVAAPLTAALTPGTGTTGTGSVTLDPNGGFKASVTAPGTYSFAFRAQTALGTQSTSTTVTLFFPAGSNLAVTVLDGADKTTVLTDYRWIIEEDRTFYVDPNCTKNPLPAGCPAATPQGAPAVFGTNFHTSHMPVVATGCTGPLSCESGQMLQGQQAVCDVGNGICRTTAAQETPVDPKFVKLDPAKRYYISVLPGDAANPFNNGYAGTPTCQFQMVNGVQTNTPNSTCGHGMGGAPIGKAQLGSATPSVLILTQPSPYPPAKLTVFVFEDDYPLNGEHDSGGGIDVLSPNEPGLGGFQITLFDDAGGTGDATGQPTYDMFNMPLTNSLAGTIDPSTGFDACPISPVVTANVQQAGANATPDQCSANPALKGCQKGIVGMIVTCPTYEADGTTLSPLAGQAIVNNLYQGRYGVVANPGADRIARGEEWLQTNTLDGQKAHDSFMRIGEPAYFQEYGPAGYHVTIGFANPKIIRDRKPAVCAGAANCTNEVKGFVSTARMSRVPDERLYGSGSRDSYAFTQCYVSLGDPDGADFDFVKCAPDGSFDFTGIPPGNWKLTIFDQWNDQIVDGIMQPVGITGSNQVINMGEIAAHQWQANIYTRTFFDANGNGVSDKDAAGNDLESGLTLVATNVRFRDGSFSNFNNTDLNGYAGFNEVFPLFSWYTVETDTTRFKTTGVHVVYDSGGPVDRSSPGGTACSTSTNPACGNSNIGQAMANTFEAYPLPPALSVPGAVYCADADCGGYTGRTAGDTSGPSIRNGPTPSGANSTGRIDPPFWFGSYGWQGFSGQNSFLEFGKKPYVPGETGGIHGHVVYASTRPFDDPKLLLQTSWEPLVPHVRINLYKEDIGSDGVTQTLTLIDQTETSSWDDWAQGFRTDGVPNMNCPGQAGSTDPFFYSLQNQPQWLDLYNHGAGNTTSLPFNSQFKCYDGMHNWNQLQPAPYDGMYAFPSVTSFNPATGRPAGTNCTACVTNPDATDPYRYGGSTTPGPFVSGASSGTPMLPPGKYVVEVVVPPGYELVKEEDKNILIGDNYIAPVTQQFAGLGNIFILPDQAEVASACNGTSAAQNPTCNLGRHDNLPSHEGDTGSIESYWPCVGALRTVPDFISLYPQSAEISPFAGAVRPLCDRKEVTLTDQSAALAKFYVFTSTHAAAHFTGIITDDFTAEFDPFSPQFGEKFAPAYLPVSLKDWTGNEISRVYADQWGTYNGLSYSTWEVNPPNPTGYGPTMMVVCMNDSGSGTPSPMWDSSAGTGFSKTPDPLFQPQYSQFCYELPFMPGQTGYFDTPVVPNTAFSEGYNHPDCNYADATPAIKEVDGDGVGPWVAAGLGHTLKIAALGDQVVDNYGYSGPSITTAPFNQQKVTRHYGFGSAAGTVSLVSPPNAAGGTTTLNLAATAVSWSDTSITATLPGTLAAAFNCPVQQQPQYGGPPATAPAKCAQLVITAANGKKSVDTVTVTIGGKAPTRLAAGQTVQSAINAAMPGDLIIVPAGVHPEMLLMWKPIRLQGVGAASAIIDASPHPAGKLDPWRKQVGCLFGLSPDGRPADASDPAQANAYAAWTANCLSNGYKYFSGGPNYPAMVVDRLPGEGIIGWDTTVNGNLAEQLIEPSLLGAYEGAAISVMGKGVNIPPQAVDPWGSGAEAAYPAGSALLSASNCAWSGTAPVNAPPTPYPGNFYCNPSSVDGLGLTNSSQGGGGIFVHAWAHKLQIANNRVYSNSGTLSGGITVGQGEHIDLPLGGAAYANVLPPGSCEPPGMQFPASLIDNLGLPYCYDYGVNVHHNSVTLNSSMGDQLFSSTPSGAGGVSIANGSDYYRLTNNWVCGNLSTGDGGGVAHIGWSKNGLIDSNKILFNQSTNPTVPTNGGGLLVMGAPDPDPTCATNNDKDCVPAPGDIPPSDGTGLGLVINANLIMGNSADSGSGGGLRLQHVNGTDAVTFPNGALACTSIRQISPFTPGQIVNGLCAWNSVSVTNNIIVNNVSGWDGAGVSLQDALAVNIINNTIASNDSTASSGVLFASLFAPLASAPGTNCTNTSGTGSCPQVAGLVSVTNSPVLMASLPATGFTCPIGHGSTSLTSTGSACRSYSIPELVNDVIWQNRSFDIGVGSFGSGQQNQQKMVTLVNAFTGTPAPSQPQADAYRTDGNGVVVTGGTGACVPGVSYWDVGVRGDLGPGDHSSGFSLSLTTSFLTSTAGYTTGNNSASDPTVLSQYCNGSRVPPELGSMGYQVPPGTNETNALPTPVFNLRPSATVDEGNNWINLRWGPLASANPVSGATLGNYGPAAGSPVINYVSLLTAPVAYAVAPSTDFFGNPRKNGALDSGAVEFVAGSSTRAAAVSANGLPGSATGTAVR